MKWEIRQKVDLQVMTPQRATPECLFMVGNAQAHRWKVEVYSGGTPVDIDGRLVVAMVQRPDGLVAMLKGIAQSNVAEVVLDSACCGVAGHAQALMTLTSSDQVITVAEMRFRVGGDLGDTVIDSSDMLPSLSELLSQVADMRAATEECVAATDEMRELLENAGSVGGSSGSGGTGTVTSVNGIKPDAAGNVEMEIPQAAEDVGADPAGTAASKVSTHNADVDAHPAIRQLVSDLSGRLSALADSDDTTLDQLSEIVAYIKSNKSLIDNITTGKVSTADVVNNLTSTATTKPLSAAQGKALKALIDAIVVPTKLSELAGDATHRLVTDAEKTAWNAKSTFSGKYADLTGKPTKVSAFENDEGYLTEHQDISHLLPRTELGAAVDVALAKAKASGAFDGEDGEDGMTPVKGVDYYTEADKAEFSEYIAAELAKRGQIKPEFANSIEECTDTSLLYVLPDGYIYAYIATATEGEKVPNFTNVMKSEGAYVKAGYRYSHSSAAFKACTTDDAIVIPISNGSHTVRVRGAGSGGSYTASFYYGDNNQTFGFVPNDGNITRTVESNGDITITCNISSAITHCVFHVEAGVDPDTLIVTVDQEITYTTTPGSTVYQWASTEHAFVPADYEGRIVANEQNISTLQTETKNLADRLDGLSINAGGSTENIVFSIPAFAPVPQKAPTADGGGIMDVRAIRTDTYYEYMDGLVAKHPNYLYKQYMGKDMTNTYDHYRYIACRSYYHAWVLDNYPKMFGWKNGNTVVYSVSVSPRVGDAMYSTPYIGTVHGTVSVVNCNFDPVKASTRTVGDVEFERYATADVEPTVVYTTVKREYEGCTVYNSAFASSTTVSGIVDGVMTCADGKTYTRYPFEDKRNDKSRPLSVFILSNEHAGCNWGDSSIVSIIVAQFLTDLCENKHIPFLRWLKDNCILTVIPVGNPWGYSEDSINGYNNGNGVNINRNYDTPGWCLGEYDLGGGHGEYAGSESETQHIMNTIHLCAADVGMSMHGVGHHNETPTQDGYIQMQGNGFDSTIRRPIDEIMTTSYNLGLEGDTTVVNDPYHAGKSPSYIQWAGAVGGLTETVPWNALTGEYFDSVSMEAGYTEMLLFLQCWIKEALQKAAE